MGAAMGVVIAVGAERSQMVDCLRFQINPDDALSIPGSDFAAVGAGNGMTSQGMVDHDFVAGAVEIDHVEAGLVLLPFVGMDEIAGVKNLRAFCGPAMVMSEEGQPAALAAVAADDVNAAAEAVLPGARGRRAWP